VLLNKSLVELRGIAQSFNIPDIFQKDTIQLIQAIEMKQQGITPAPKVEIPRPEYDARLMTKPPSKRSDKEAMEELLAPHIARGLHFKVDENAEWWSMSHGKRTDEGTMRMPLKTVLRCAEKLFE
jgi:hypothetical protein